MTAFHLDTRSADNARTRKILEQLALQGFELVSQEPEEIVAPHPVVLIWSRETDSAALALDPEVAALAQAGRLISVLVEKVKLPNTLPSHAVLDLVGWRGSPENAFFKDLVEALCAAALRKPPPRPRGPTGRLIRRLCGGLTVGVVLAFSVAVALNILELQNNLCSINFQQPHLSDFCGKWGLGNKPNREERLAWEAREPESCDALRQHMEQFPGGALISLAADHLNAKTVEVDERWVADEVRWPYTASVPGDGTIDEATAKTVAMRAATQEAETICKAYAESDLYRFVSVTLQEPSWKCFELLSGHFCGFDAQQVCQLERLERTNREVCRTSNP